MLNEALKTRLIKQLRLHEGVEKFPYRDTVGKLIIGVGRNLTDRGLSNDEIDYILVNDIHVVERIADLYHWYEALTDNRKLVVLDMLFNLGQPRFEKFQRMIAAIEAADWREASEQMLTSRWARQVKGRAVTLGTMMLNG